MLQVILFVASLVLSWLTRSTQDQQQAQPGTIESDSAEEGAPIGILFGTRDIPGTPSVVWYGDTRNVAIKKSSGGKK